MSSHAYYGDSQAPTQQQGYGHPGGGNEMPQQHQQQHFTQQQGQGGQQYAQQQQHEQNGQGGGYNEPLQKKDTMTKILEKLEQRIGGERFTNPDNAAKNRAMNENIIKKLTYAAKLVMQRAPGYAMNYGRQLF